MDSSQFYQEEACSKKFVFDLFQPCNIIFVCNCYRLWPTSPCIQAHFKCVCCVQIPSQLWNVFFLNLMIALLNESCGSTTSNEAMCSSFFFGQNKGYNLLGFPIGLFGFSMGLISLTKSLNPCAFLYPYFVLIFNGALGWTEIPLLISRIPMISIFFGLCPCFWY